MMPSSRTKPNPARRETCFRKYHFELCACLRWKRLPTWTVACSEILTLCGGRRQRFGQPRALLTGDPLPSLSSPWLESCDARVPGAQPCTQIGRIPVGMSSATYSRRCCQITPSFCIQRISMQPGSGGKSGKAEMPPESIAGLESIAWPKWADVAAICLQSRFSRRPLSSASRSSLTASKTTGILHPPWPQAPSIDPWAGEKSSPNGPPFPAPARRGPHPPTPQSHQGAKQLDLATLPDDQNSPSLTSRQCESSTGSMLAVESAPRCGNIHLGGADRDTCPSSIGLHDMLPRSQGIRPQPQPFHGLFPEFVPWNTTESRCQGCLYANVRQLDGASIWRAAAALIAGPCTSLHFLARELKTRSAHRQRS